MSHRGVPPELPNLIDLDHIPRLPRLVWTSFAVVGAAAVLAGTTALTYGIVAAELWPCVAGLAFFMLAVSQFVGYMWRVEAHEAHAQAVALGEQVEWFYTNE